MDAPLLEVSNLTAAYSRGLSRKADITAVRDVSFSVGRGETLGLIGESGSGKSTVLNTIAGLMKPRGGSIFFEGENIAAMKSRRRTEFRHRVAMLFQSAAVNPKMTVHDIISEPIRNFYKLSRAEEQMRVHHLLELAELSSSSAVRYPDELSGGQLQRVSIARALALKPSLLLADEPVTALDVCVKAQILDMLRGLCQSFGLACVFVTHDLGVARHMCRHICIMLQGGIVERGSVSDLFDSPQQPYTKRLIESILPAIPTARNTIGGVRAEGS